MYKVTVKKYAQTNLHEFLNINKYLMKIHYGYRYFLSINKNELKSIRLIF